MQQTSVEPGAQQLHTMHERYAWSLINVRVPKAPDKKKTITADSFWTDVLLACRNATLLCIAFEKPNARDCDPALLLILICPWSYSSVG